MSSVITISQPLSVPESKCDPDTAVTFAHEDESQDSSSASDTVSDCSSPVEIKNLPGE